MIEVIRYGFLSLFSDYSVRKIATLFIFALYYFSLEMSQPITPVTTNYEESMEENTISALAKKEKQKEKSKKEKTVKTTQRKKETTKALEDGKLI